MSLLKPILSFAGGEVSPWIDTRFDIEKYEGSCRIVENFIVLPQGVDTTPRQRSELKMVEGVASISAL